VKLTGLFVYPVKGARGISLREVDVDARGLAHDRRFMVVDASGAYVTQRGAPRLALLETEIDGDDLLLRAAGGAARLPLSPRGTRRPVVVWDDTCDAVDCGDDAARVVTALIGSPSRLVHMPDDVVRPVDPAFAAPGDRVGFADGFPILVTTEASLRELNARLERPVPMDRFRPNLVLDGEGPFDEDLHTALRVGSIDMRMPKRCARCVVTTVDQATAEVSKEPLRTLATFRTADKGVYFGQNAIPDASGVLRVGDEATFGRVGT
jgi:uncharacterized protein